MSSQNLTDISTLIKNETAEEGNTRERISSAFNIVNSDKADLLNGKIPYTQLPPAFSTMYKGYLKKSDPAPTVPGLYRLLEIGAYNNLTPAVDENGNTTVVTAVVNKINEAYFNGTKWQPSYIEMPSSAAKTTFDPADNVNPATMKADSDNLINNYTGIYPKFAEPNKMEDPYPGFSIEQGYAGLSNAVRYFQDPALLKDRYIHKIRAKVISVDTWSIFIVKKSDLTLDHTVPISKTNIDPVTLIVEHVFDTPIDTDLYYVTFTQGFAYYPTFGAKPVKTINSGAIIDNVQVTLAAEYYTYPTLTLGPSIKIVDRLKALENKATIPAFQWSNIMLDTQAILKIIVKESAGSVYDITAGKINITSNTAGNGIVINNNIALNRRSLEFDIKLSTTSTVLYFGSKPIEQAAGSYTFEVDFNAKTINGANYPNIDVNTTDMYRVSFITIDQKSIIKVKNMRTTQEITTGPMTVSGEWDQYKIGFNSGGGSIENLKIFSNAKERPYIIFYGDSITGATNIANADRFANLVGTAINKEYLLSSRSSGTILGLASRVVVEVPSFRPKYVCITIGTNGSNTPENLTSLVNFCQSYGCIVILNRIPLFDGITASRNAMIQSVVDAKKLLSVKLDVATSIGFDGVTKDNTSFTNDSGTFIHPNEKGNKQIFDRFKIDAAEVFINAGVAL